MGRRAPKGNGLTPAPTQPLPTGGHLEQADGTVWMALFSQNMLELAVHDRTNEDMVSKFLEHFRYISAARNPNHAVKEGVHPQ